MIESKVYKGYKIEIEQDDYPDDPRNWDNLGTMVCVHKRYSLGDIDNRDEAIRIIDEIRYNGTVDGKEIIYLPLYLYDHSNIWMSADNSKYPFNDRWDSMFVGYIHVTIDRIRKEFGIKRITKKVRDRVIRILNNEVKIYSKYISGEVFRFQIMKDGEVIDSCGGFYDYHEALEEAKSVVDVHYKEQLEKRIEKIKGWIRKRVPLIYRKFDDSLEVVK